MKRVVFSLAILFSVFAGYAQPVGGCPPTEGEYTKHFPDAEKCNLFWKCDNGTAVQQECPGGLYFNPISDMCDFPSMVDCQQPEEGEDVYTIYDYPDMYLKHKWCVKYWAKYDAQDNRIESLVITGYKNKCVPQTGTRCVRGEQDFYCQVVSPPDLYEGYWIQEGYEEEAD